MNKGIIDVESHVVINKSNDIIEVAIFEDSKLVRFEREFLSDLSRYRKHAVLIGRVVNYAAGVNALFIDVGWKKNGFLPLEPSELKTLEINKRFFSSITGYYYPIGKEVPGRGEPLLVKISREPMEDKGPMLTTSVTVPGRYFVLLPMESGILFARGAFKKEQKETISEKLRKALNNRCGVIVRRTASKRNIDDILPELDYLKNKWENTIREIKNKWRDFPVWISEGDNIISVIVRDYFPEGNIILHINDEAVLKEVISAASFYGIKPQKVKLYPPHKDIYVEADFDKEMSRTFSRNVPFGNGAFLIIESTALGHYIDVNAGSLATMYEDIEKLAYSVNMMAVDEIVRQIQIRNMGGQIIIDFITMKNPEHIRSVENAFREAMSEEYGNYAMSSINEFGIMTITRRKKRDIYTPDFESVCSVCGGSGVAPLPQSLVITLEECIKKILKHNTLRYLRIEVNPVMEAFIRYGMPSWYMKWTWKFKIFINLVSVDNLPLNVFRFYDFNGRELLPAISS